MKRNEYIEILKDYLEQMSDSETERQDILRDIEEMIEDGLSSGKTEEQVINDLGSPKNIAMELTDKIIDTSTRNFDLTNKGSFSKKTTLKNQFGTFKDMGKKSGKKVSVIIRKILKAIYKICISLIALGLIFSEVGVFFLTILGTIAAIMFYETSISVFIFGISCTLLGIGYLIAVYQFIRLCLNKLFNKSNKKIIDTAENTICAPTKYTNINEECDCDEEDILEKNNSDLDNSNLSDDVAEIIEEVKEDE